MDERNELLKRLEEKIGDGRDTVQRLRLMGRIDGIDKLIRKIQQEIKFLERVRCTGKVKKEYLQSTNLIHLDAMVSRLSGAEEPVAVVKPFKYRHSRLEVDIVCNDGATWVKVIARNARALTLISLGNGEYGQKSVLDQANSYLLCSRCHLHRYRPPDVTFHFAYGVEIPLASRLEQMGIIVEGERIDAGYEEACGQYDVPEHDKADSREESTSDSGEESAGDLQSLNTSALSTEIKLLNLDVSTLLAYVTNMTNGHNNYVYREPLLTQQAEMERKRPIKQILENLFKDKELLVCQTAYKNFMNIIDVIGGPNETHRARELLKGIRIVDDMPVGRVMERLRLGGRIKDRSRLIFATGENMKSITVSANEGFVRAARMQGIECTVFLHEPRSLSEIKEGNAMSIEPS